jgi:hypothetical protein
VVCRRTAKSHLGEACGAGSSERTRVDLAPKGAIKGNKFPMSLYVGIICTRICIWNLDGFLLLIVGMRNSESY